MILWLYTANKMIFRKYFTKYKILFDKFNSRPLRVMEEQSMAGLEKKNSCQKSLKKMKAKTLIEIVSLVIIMQCVLYAIYESKGMICLPQVFIKTINNKLSFFSIYSFSFFFCYLTSVFCNFSHFCQTNKMSFPQAYHSCRNV